MNQFMERAVELALDNVDVGGQPFGAVLVNDGEIIAEGVNELHLLNDISGHAELLAIRRAQARLETIDLSGCTIYASGEPCPMCLSAMYFSNIETVYYSQSVEDAQAVGLGKSMEIYQDLKGNREARQLKTIQLPLKETDKNPMKTWAK